MPRFQANFHLYAEDLERAISFYTQNFNFRLLGQMDDEQVEPWAALQIENAILWLGKEGSSSGLILLLDKEIENFVSRLQEKGVEFFFPEKFRQEWPHNSLIMQTSWGKHAWLLDSERNVVMLFQPVED